MRTASISCLLSLVLLASGVGAAETFPLKDGDVWVMAGDSITAQHLHSNYFEAFCYARYPAMKFSFRNSGVGGDTIPKVLARFDWDVAAWKPTVVSVELGMNDQGGYSVPQFIENMGKLVEKIKSIQARPVMLTSSPINNGGTNQQLGGNKKLHEFAEALKTFAAAQNLPFSDQFHMVIDVWGNNKPRENLATLKGSIENAIKDEKLAGAEHLKAFLAELAKDPQPLVSMQGDAVHPGPPGQLIMAAALLKQLNAEGFVSSAELDATGKIVEAKKCAIADVKAENGALSFSRLDEAIAFPIPDDARSVLPMFPTILELSQYTLKVTGLSAAQYALKINGADVATVAAKDLERGINLTAFAQGPIAAQGKAVLNAVNAKEGAVGQWRGLSKAASAADAPADAKQKLATVAKSVEDADEKIRAAAKPVKLMFELSPLK
jgi:lysophospholipase L1-like esterase